MYSPQPVTLSTLMEISIRHFMMTVRISSTCLSFIAFNTMAAMRVIGVSMPHHPLILAVKFKIFVLKHKLWMIGLYFILFALPGNLTALWVLMAFPFRDYQIFPVQVKSLLPPPTPVIPTGSSRSFSRLFTFVLKIEKGFDELRAWLRTRGV